MVILRFSNAFILEVKFRQDHCFLTLPVPCISESCTEIKLKLNFYFHASLWFLKRFERPYSVKINIYSKFFSTSGIGILAIL